MYKKKLRHKKKNFLKKTGFSEVFLLLAVALGIAFVGALSGIDTANPQQAILDPNQSFANPTGKETLQLRTLAFITPTYTPTVAPTSAPNAPSTQAPALCKSGGANSEPEILV